MNYKKYTQELETNVKKEVEIAKRARAKGIDFSEEPEIYIARDLAERVEGLVELPGIADTIRKLKKQYESELEISFNLVKEVIGKEKDREKAADLAIRTSLAFLTQGAVAAPLEGIAKIKINKNPDGTEYLSIYFSGPIRAAGGTAEALAVVLADFTRKSLGLSAYQPTLKEIGRYAEEIQWYHRHVHLQYMPSEQEVETIIRNTPVCITGEPTEKYEVANYRDLGRVETNRVRGGTCLVIAEGIAQKAQKLLKRLRGLQEKYDIDWSWLEALIVKKAYQEKPELKSKIEDLDTTSYDWLSNPLEADTNELSKVIEISREEGSLKWLDDALEEEPQETGKNKKYIQETPAGRPVFSYPGRKGGFTLRYGRTRASGYAALAINPATMRLLDNFIAIGTQIRIEFPGKAGIVTPCESIAGPFVRLENGEALRINTTEDAEKHKNKVEKIIHLGDLLVSVGDFLENNNQLKPGAYCEEWWAQEVLEKTHKEGKDKETAPYLYPPYKTPPFETAYKISKKHKVPLHPKYTFYWDYLTLKQLKTIITALKAAKTKKGQKILPSPAPLKNALEILGVAHKKEGNNIILEKDAEPLLKTIGNLKTIDGRIEKEALHTSNVLKIINNIFGVTIKNKAPTTIGARMGRPEKAKLRKMVPAPNALFPTGGAKGRVRDVVKAAENNENIRIDLVKYICPNCRAVQHTPKCKKCDAKTNLVKYCPRCGRTLPKERDGCPACKIHAVYFEKRTLNLKEVLTEAKKLTQTPTLVSVKGILGMSSKIKFPEPLEKGILRAKHNLFVFKDGTIRFDSTNAPLTHFTPKEINTPIKKLQKLGYDKDTNGNLLKREDQILQLKPQDVIVSDYKEESGAETLLNIAKFVDELLEKIYKIEPFYKTKNKKDLVGHLVIGLAPHTSTGTVGRIIGFSKTRTCYANPCFHDAKRRDCDGDEDSLILLLDALLNFSKAFLPDKRGGKMDAPLVISTKLDPLELDEEVYDVDIASSYPLSFYRAAEENKDPNEIDIRTIRNIVNDEDPFVGWGFTHAVGDISNAPRKNRYTEGDMREKLWKQLGLAEKIWAVDENDLAERIIRTHFLPDIRGNLRTFAKQKVRCTNCNTKYRRAPLSNTCLSCGGNLVLTIHKGTITKYMDPTREMIKKYKINPYIGQQIEILDARVNSIFGIEKQKKLGSFEK